MMESCVSLNIAEMSDPKANHILEEIEDSVKRRNEFPNECKKCNNSVPKKRRRNRRGRKRKYAPYSAKNFLARPKKNAPHNTSQFIFEDKEFAMMNNSFNSVESDFNFVLATSSSHSPSSSSGFESDSLSDAVTNNEPQQELLVQHASGSYSNVCDKYMTEDFDRVYEDMRAEMLRQEPVEALTSRCLELESAIHNLRYLLQKESQKRLQMEELLFLKNKNSELSYYNYMLRSTGTHVCDKQRDQL